MPSRSSQFLRLAVIVASASCAQSAPTPTPESALTEALFVERAQATGIDFVHENGMTGRFLEPESMSAGVALFDYDNDGDLDVFLVQGRVGAKARLYRNDLADGVLRFTDVTDASGIAAEGFGQGAAVGDVNNDGWLDLYVTNVGPNRMWLNRGNGTFTDVTAMSGTADPGWSISAAFVDFDRDGWLDLYVSNYLVWTAETDSNCFGNTGALDYCAPTQYRGDPDRLYRNRRNGTFEDVTATALRRGQAGRGMGVIATDFDEDGWPDIYVTNDGEENFLWLNRRDGTFVDIALPSGLAVNAAGRPQASMGVDAGDFDRDGDEDLFITNWAGEGNVLYVRVAPGVFEDRTASTGLLLPSMPFTGFGTAWFDFDNDSWLDLFVANGAVITKEALVRAKDPYPLHEPDHLYRNLGDGRFADVSAQAGEAFELSEVGRGAAFGDVDNDGDIDVLVGNNNGRARLLLNATGNRRPWVGLSLVDRHGHRTGARVTVTTGDGTTLLRRSRSDGSYASANDARVLVGLGSSSAPPRVRVSWPGGHNEVWPQVAPGRWTTLREGAAP